MIKEAAYSDFSLRLHEASEQNNIPLDGMIALTSHCNLACSYCYIRDNTLNNELTSEDWIRIIDDITDAGCLYLLITGGEPLLRPDFKDIYMYAKGKGLILSLFTNGTLIDEKMALFLKKYMPFEVEITLYGASCETYEAFTGIQGSYDACVNGIKLLVEHQVPLSLKTMVTTINKHELAEMNSFAASLGLNFKYGLAILPHINGSLSPYDIQVSQDDALNIDFSDKERLREWTELYDKFNEPASKELLFNCGAGNNCFNITSEGKLRICDLVPEPDYCLRNGRFIEGYRMFGRITGRKLRGTTECAGCEYITFCDSCPGIAMIEGSRDGDTPVSHHCEIAHKRANYLKEVSDYAREKNI